MLFRSGREFENSTSAFVISHPIMMGCCRQLASILEFPSERLDLNLVDESLEIILHVTAGVHKAFPRLFSV